MNMDGYIIIRIYHCSEEGAMTLHGLVEQVGVKKLERESRYASARRGS